MTKPDAVEKIERYELAKLIPYANNARTHTEEQIAQLAGAMLEWGFTVPVRIDERGMIIAGHARVMAARKLMLKHVPVIVCKGWSETKKRAYIIADNKLALTAGWDTAMLLNELRALDTGEIDLTKMGFTEKELEALLAGAPPAPGDFPEVDANLPTEHECPKCGYVWSGSSKATSDG